MIDFEQYIKQNEPDKQERIYAWQTAIGLQAVDGLKTSDYLKDTACKHLERFFRNLLLGDGWELRNRYLHINAAGEWSEQPNMANASTGQAQDKCRTSKSESQY